MLKTASYIIYKDGSTYIALSGETGAIAYSSTNANYVIQSAIDVLTSGSLYFKGGGETWSLRSGIAIVNKDISIFSEPTLKASASFPSGYMIRLQGVENSRYWLNKLDGNKAENRGDFAGLEILGCKNLEILINTANFYYVDVSMPSGTLENHHIHLNINSDGNGGHASATPIYLYNKNYDIVISGSIENCTRQAIYINQVPLLFLQNLIMKNCSVMGLDIRANSFVGASNIEIDQTGTPATSIGIGVEPNATLMIDGAKIKNVQQYAVENYGTFIGNNVIIDSTQVSHNFLTRGGSDFVLLSNFEILNVIATKYGIWVLDTSAGNHKFINGKITGVGTGLRDQGTLKSIFENIDLTGITTKVLDATKVYHCDGYVTENSGTASSITNATWVSHGLASTPTTVILTPRSQVTVWCIARNSTHFQIGISGGTATIDWIAEYKP